MSISDLYFKLPDSNELIHLSVTFSKLSSTYMPYDMAHNLGVHNEGHNLLEIFILEIFYSEA